jgi:Iron-containing redox enzyme
MRSEKNKAFLIFMDTPNTILELDAMHRALGHYNAKRLKPDIPSTQWREDLNTEHKWRLKEGEYLEVLRVAIAPLLPSIGEDVDLFVLWFKNLAINGPGQNHPLFEWLANHASLEDMRWFLTQEAAGEAGFDDLIAYTQVKLPTQAKLECARNYWDEMGHGKQSAMHGHMLEQTVKGLDLRPEIDTTVWESLALANMMVGLATTRRYALQSLGALGVIELTAPGRVSKVAAGMRRLGLNGRLRAYFDLHAALDISHATAWIREIIHPLVTATPSCARYIAEGALMRLHCGDQCFKRYAKQFSVVEHSAHLTDESEELAHR